MNKYRRIEVKAFRRHVITAVDESTQERGSSRLTQAHDGVSLNDTELCEPVAPDSPEGQLILVEAVRSLERRLSPDARAMLYTSQNNLGLSSLVRIRLGLRVRSFCQSVYRKASPSGLKEK
jgi:hypothetical protein